jgi:hypothetical protein
METIFGTPPLFVNRGSVTKAIHNVGRRRRFSIREIAGRAGFRRRRNELGKEESRKNVSPIGVPVQFLIRFPVFLLS